MQIISCLSLVLIIIGALNWGLWGFFQFDFVAWLFHGNTTAASRVIYSIIGLAGLWSLRFLCKMKKLCSCCSSGGCGCGCSCCSSKGSEDKGPKGPCCK